ncbi:cassette chromosome ssDNA-binding protein [Staphylococcus pettenkoferi]|uniref:cassette chromosome ssDNA-binding protein n=1 Tax=Staphylococcus pettenkoferi TaxID=170573 RepID=UPI0011A93B6A|nr:hypothetical protein [Staphylococcus pettenkoferi]
MRKKSYKQNMLYEAAKTLTKYIQSNVEYEFNDLKIEILKTPEFENIQIPTNDQREAGRRYSYWVKKCPDANVIIHNRKSNGHLVYRKTGPTLYNNSNPSKGGDC